MSTSPPPETWRVLRTTDSDMESDQERRLLEKAAEQVGSVFGPEKGAEPEAMCLAHTSDSATTASGSRPASDM
jgi:hypothetical protein